MSANATNVYATNKSVISTIVYATASVIKMPVDLAIVSKMPADYEIVSEMQVDYEIVSEIVSNIIYATKTPVDYETVCELVSTTASAASIPANYEIVCEIVSAIVYATASANNKTKNQLETAVGVFNKLLVKNSKNQTSKNMSDHMTNGRIKAYIKIFDEKLREQTANQF